MFFFFFLLKINFFISFIILSLLLFIPLTFIINSYFYSIENSKAFFYIKIPTENNLFINFEPRYTNIINFDLLIQKTLYGRFDGIMVFWGWNKTGEKYKQKFFFENLTYTYKITFYHEKAFNYIYKNFKKKNSWWEQKFLEEKQDIILKMYNKKMYGSLNVDWYDFHGYSPLIKTYEIFI